MAGSKLAISYSRELRLLSQRDRVLFTVIVIPRERILLEYLHEPVDSGLQSGRRLNSSKMFGFPVSLRMIASHWFMYLTIFSTGSFFSLFFICSSSSDSPFDSFFLLDHLSLSSHPAQKLAFIHFVSPGAVPLCIGLITSNNVLRMIGPTLTSGAEPAQLQLSSSAHVNNGPRWIRPLPMR